jgi:hypothetical protein
MNRPTYNGFFLPYLSNRGPYISCPKEMPIKKEERESITEDTGVFKSFAMVGKAGKYISIESGPMELNNPRIRMR